MVHSKLTLRVIFNLLIDLVGSAERPLFQSDPTALTPFYTLLW